MITAVRLQQFRSYIDSSFEFGAGVNIIVGPNGSGKTNLLEAILCIARGTSYRVPDDGLIQFGRDWLRIDATTEPKQTRTLKIMTAPQQTKTYEIDSTQFVRFPAHQAIPVVLFEPNDLGLLHGAPELRRNYLDDILEQTNPGFSSFRRNYRRVLAQRNALLKTGRRSPDELFPWNLRMSELGAVIARARAELVTRFDAELAEQYESIARNKQRVHMRYAHQFPIERYETNFIHKLESSFERDRERGFTGSGPHREDCMVSFGETPVGLVASRGETRSVILALKILELAIVTERCGKAPLLLLDDVFSELDSTRRQAITSHLQTHQTFLTTTDADSTSGTRESFHIQLP